MREPWTNGGGSTAASAVLCVLWAPPGRGVDAKLASALQRPRMTVVQHDDEFAVLGALCRDVREQGKGGAQRGHILLLVEPARLPQVPDVLGTLSRHVPNLAIWVFDPGSTDVLRAVSLDEAITLAGGSPQPRGVAGTTRYVTSINGANAGTGAAPVQVQVPLEPRSAPAPREVKPAPRDAAPPTNTTTTGMVGPWVESTVEPWTPPAQPKLRLAGESQPSAPAPAPQPVAQPTPVPPPAPAPAPMAQMPGDTAPLLTDEELSMLLGDDTPKGETRG